MTGKRFTLIYGIDENPFEWDIMDNEKDALICRSNGKPICDLLNELAEENEQLKQSYAQLKHRHSLLHDVCIEAECDRDGYYKDVVSLEKENEQLKKDVEYWKQVASQYSNELNVNDSTKSRNDKEKSCGYCKNYNLDGMFGIWCSIHETPTSDKYCHDFEWKR